MMAISGALGIRIIRALMMMMTVKSQKNWGALLEVLVDPGLPPHPLADVVGRGKRQDAGPKERSIEQAEGEQGRGMLADQRFQGHGGIGSGFDLETLYVDGRGAGHHHEEGHDDGHDAADDDIEPGEGILFGGDPLFHDGRLLVELHPGGDGGADDADQGHDVGAVALEGRGDGGLEHEIPVRAGHESGNRVGDVDQAGHQENLFHDLVGSLDDQQPDSRAQTGTEIYLLMPKISRLAAMPANSEMEFPMLVRKRAIMT